MNTATRSRRLFDWSVMLLLVAVLSACGTPGPNEPARSASASDVAEAERVLETFMTVCIARNRPDFIEAAAREGFGSLPPDMLTSEVFGRNLTDRDIVLARRFGQGLQVVFWNDAVICEMTTTGVDPSLVDDAFVRTMRLATGRPGSLVHPLNASTLPSFTRRPERPLRAFVYGVRVQTAIAARLFVLSVGEVPRRGPYTLFSSSRVSVQPAGPVALPEARQQ